jgi:two-component system, NarL family, nitrate/nitrite response regulator NarL
MASLCQSDEAGAYMISILLVDDHTYIRKGIRSLIEATADMEVVATASNGIEGVAKARVCQPDIIIMDISMPFMDGIEAIRQIRGLCPHTRILTLSIYDNPTYIEGALQAGARGYVLKDAIGNELLEAIHALHIGERYFSQKVASHIYLSMENDNSLSVMPSGEK